MASTKPTRAAIYARISLDKNGDGLGVDRQRDLCSKLAKEKGWTVAATYIDNDRSASNGKPRPEYERMLADIEAGRVDGVLVVDQDRLVRRPVELERFIDLADRLGVALANVSGDTDLSTSDGRFRARIIGDVARHEGEKKGERVSREAEQAARRGIPRARRAFGWEPDRVTIREPEAALIREAATRMVAGENAATICRDWNERGVPTTQSAKRGWSAEALASIVRSPRVAGLRAFKGEVVGEGQQEPILDRATWEQLRASIRRVARPGRPAAHLLAGIARCSECGSALWSSATVKNGKNTPRYVCTKRQGAPGCGAVSITAAHLDDLVRDAVIAALAGPKLARARRRRQGDDREQERAAKEMAAAEARREEMAADYATGTIDRREWMAAREALDERVTAARKVLDRHAGPLADLPGDETALCAAWDSNGVEWRRALVGRVVERVTVSPATSRGRGFDPERVTIDWRA
jgi:site-specific DNA recombinase